MEAPSKDHDPYYGTQVLVLGATGCIGSWVARSLCARGSKLSLVVRDKEASERVFSFYNIRGDVFVVDVENLEAVAKLLHRIKPSITFNLHQNAILDLLTKSMLICWTYSWRR
jgi:saccharopine dehydrogenase-like NADP-dependent oxidoreductase